jgi:hypothetical protein
MVMPRQSMWCQDKAHGHAKTEHMVRKILIVRRHQGVTHQVSCMFSFLFFSFISYFYYNLGSQVAFKAYPRFSYNLDSFHLLTCSVHHGCGYGSENSHHTRTRSNHRCTVRGVHRTQFIRGCIWYTVLVITHVLLLLYSSLFYSFIICL